MWSLARELAPGLLLVGLLAMAAAWLSEHYRAPILLFALLLGMAMNFLRQDGRFTPGLNISTRGLLRVGVALLGARITLGQLSSLGGDVVLLVAGAVAATIGLGWVLAKVLRLPPDFGLLTGGAVGICGASAAMALAAALPPSPTRERETALTVVAVTALWALHHQREGLPRVSVEDSVGFARALELDDVVVFASRCPEHLDGVRRQPRHKGRVQRDDPRRPVRMPQRHVPNDEAAPVVAAPDRTVGADVIQKRDEIAA